MSPIESKTTRRKIVEFIPVQDHGPGSGGHSCEPDPDLRERNDLDMVELITSCQPELFPRRQLRCRGRALRIRIETRSSRQVSQPPSRQHRQDPSAIASRHRHGHGSLLSRIHIRGFRRTEDRARPGMARRRHGLDRGRPRPGYEKGK